MLISSTSYTPGKPVYFPLNGIIFKQQFGLWFEPMKELLNLYCQSLLFAIVYLISRLKYNVMCQVDNCYALVWL